MMINKVTEKDIFENKLNEFKFAIVGNKLFCKGATEELTKVVSCLLDVNGSITKHDINSTIVRINKSERFKLIWAVNEYYYSIKKKRMYMNCDSKGKNEDWYYAKK